MQKVVAVVGAIVVIVTVVLGVGLAFELNHIVPNSTTSSLNTSSTTNSTTSSTSSTSPAIGTAWFGAESSPSSCGSMSKAGAFSGDGYRTTIYFPTGNPPGVNQFPLGSTICILVYLQNLDNQSTSLPSVETVKISSINNQSESSGITFYEFGCSVPGSYNGSFGPNSTGWGCVATWDTSKPYNGILPTTASPDIYNAIVTISMANSRVIQVEDSFGFTT